MEKDPAPALLKILANDLRWQIVRALSHSDLRVQELTDRLNQPQNLVSYHLKKLHQAGLVVEHHSIADGREIYYGIHLNRIRDLFKTTQESIHPGLTVVNKTAPAYPPLRVLFLCTHNSARSQMAEGLLRSRSHSQIEVFSAGTDPMPVNLDAIRVMQELDIDIHNQQSKSQDQFLDQSFDYVITVCDRARESCPVFPGNPLRLHWSIADPTAASGSSKERLRVFRATARELEERIDNFLAGISGQS